MIVSYSRWINSNWYSFWNTSSGESKDDQILSLWHVSNDCTDFSYEHLEKFDISTMKTQFPEASEEDLVEGLGYIKEFLEDVDAVFLEDDLK